MNSIVNILVSVAARECAVMVRASASAWLAFVMMVEMPQYGSQKRKHSLTR
jgi:hypothetical protein